MISKKSYTFSLTKEHVDHLNEMSEASKVNRSIILQLLIDRAYENFNNGTSIGDIIINNERASALSEAEALERK